MGYDFVKDYIDKRELGRSLAQIDENIETYDYFKPTVTNICEVCKHYDEDLDDKKCPCKKCSHYYKN